LSQWPGRFLENRFLENNDSRFSKLLSEDYYQKKNGIGGRPSDDELSGRPSPTMPWVPHPLRLRIHATQNYVMAAQRVGSIQFRS
jgi:hypothetical protein